MLPSIDVACPNGDCRAGGVRQRVMLRRIAPTVLEVPRLICAACGHEPETVRPYTPEGEASMPKITRLGGPSIAADDTPASVPVLVGEPGPELELRESAGTGTPMTPVDGDELTGDGTGEALPPVDEAAPDSASDDEGGASSPGNSSPTSSEKPQTKPEPTSKPRQSRARATGSRSARGQTGSRTARGTGGGQTEAGSATAD